MAKAVIFDKDGVIIQTTPLYFERWKRTFAKYKKELTLDFHNKQLSGRKARESIRKYLDPNITVEDLTKLLQEQYDFTLLREKPRSSDRGMKRRVPLTKLRKERSGVRFGRVSLFRSM